MGAWNEPPDRVRAAWDALQDAWDQPARHDAFLALASETDSFAWAARQYKERAGDAIADERLQRIQRAAIARMMATATQRPESRKWVRMLILLVLATIVTVGVGLFIANSLR